jgi:hypothetical protein
VRHRRPPSSDSLFPFATVGREVGREDERRAVIQRKITRTAAGSTSAN